MNASCFMDTNVLVYAASGRDADEKKRLRALDCLEEVDFGTSGQVLQEFFVTVTRKIKAPLSRRDAAEWIDRLALRPVIPVDAGLVKSAIYLSDRFLLSHWDAAIIAAAQALEAAVVYTEDLNHGQTYDTVRAVNPFRDD